MSFGNVLANLSTKGKITIGAGALVVVLVALLGFKLASAPSYTTLETGLDPAQTGKMTAALSSAGVSYQLQNGGTALAVDQSQISRARVALATQGLPSPSQPGFSLFDKQSLGTSQFQQQVTYQRALEGQIAQTIQQVQGVSGASVQLVLPNQSDQLFADSSPPATAAVLLSGTTSMDPGSVQGIARLVSSSVQGLKPENVTITDASGAMLWPTGSGTGAGGLLTKLSAENRYDQTMQAQLGALLAQAVGSGKAEVQVHADLNADQATRENLTYAKKGVPLEQKVENESLRGAGGTTGGTAGTAGNIPGITASAGGGGNTKYSHKTTDTSYGIDKTITHTRLAAGTVNKQSVSILVDSSVPKAALPALQKAVANAAGITKGRDQISIAQVAFAKPAVPAKPPLPMMNLAKYGLLGLGTVIFLFLLARQLRRRESEVVADPAWLRAIETPRAAPAAALAAPQETVRMRPLPEPELDPNRQALESMAEKDPDRVAQQVRTWLKEE